jgi:hypothetical protein
MRMYISSVSVCVQHLLAGRMLCTGILRDKEIREDRLLEMCKVLVGGGGALRLEMARKMPDNVIFGAETLRREKILVGSLVDHQMVPSSPKFRSEL